MLTVLEVRNPRHTAHNHFIDMDVLFAEYAPEWLPYSAEQGNTSGNGDDLYNRALAGEFGPIAPYVEYAASISEILACKASEIQTEKKRVCDSGVMVDDVLFDTDERARLAYLEFFGMLSQNPAHTEPAWKASGSTFVEMTPELFYKVVAARKTQESAAFAWQNLELEQIKTLSDAGDYDGLNGYVVAFVAG